MLIDAVITTFYFFSIFISYLIYLKNDSKCFIEDNLVTVVFYALLFLGLVNIMQKAINFENAKLQSNVETGKVFNTLANTTPVYINVSADVEMDKTKVGRIVTPVVSETLKTGGLRW